MISDMLKMMGEIAARMVIIAVIISFLLGAGIVGLLTYIFSR